MLSRARTARRVGREAERICAHSYSECTGVGVACERYTLRALMPARTNAMAGAYQGSRAFGAEGADVVTIR